MTLILVGVKIETTDFYEIVKKPNGSYEKIKDQPFFSYEDLLDGDPPLKEQLFKPGTVKAYLEECLYFLSRGGCAFYMNCRGDWFFGDILFKNSGDYEGYMTQEEVQAVCDQVTRACVGTPFENRSLTYYIQGINK